MLPTELLFLCIGLIGAAVVIHDWNDDDDETVVEPTPPDDDDDDGDDDGDGDGGTVAEPVPPNEGTDGNDTVTGYDESADEDRQLSLLAGDDLLDLPSTQEIHESTIDLGAGDDTLRGGGNLVTSVHGGEGDDLIETDAIEGAAFSGVGHSINGDEGDDTIVGPMRDDRVFGGDGNDVIDIQDAGLVIFDEQTSVPFVNGGDGQDSFIVGISASSELVHEYNDPGLGSQINFGAAVAYIDDFQPGQDELVIDPTTYAQGTDYIGYEIVQGTDGSSLVVLTFADSADPTQQIPISIEVNSSSPLTHADIRVINTESAVANG